MSAVCRPSARAMTNTPSALRALMPPGCWMRTLHSEVPSCVMSKIVCVPLSRTFVACHSAPRPKVIIGLCFLATSRRVREVSRHDERSVRGQDGDELPERVLDVIEVAVDVGVVELDGGEQQRLRRGSAGTSAPCRRTRCRTRRPRRRSAARRRAEVAVEVRASRRRPARSDRGRRACSTHASMLVVVVLPCVPATTTRACRSAMKQLRQRLRQRHVRHSRSSAPPRPPGWSRDTALPTTTRSGRPARFSGAEALSDADAQALEQRAHRRVDVLIGSRHLEAALLEHAGERRHGDAADGDQMDTAGGARLHGFGDSVGHRSRQRER